MIALGVGILLAAPVRAQDEQPVTDQTQGEQAADQPQCLADQEPNDSPETAQAVAGAFCIDGSISDSDQEILAWTVDAASAAVPWTISLSGPQGLQTRLQIHRLEEPGTAETPAVVGPELVAVVTPPGANSVERKDVYLTPGTWLIGVSVSAGDGGVYHVGFAAGAPAAAANTADNSAPAAAVPVANGFALQGVLAKSEAWYAWTLSGIEARKRWSLAATAPLGAAVGFELQTTDGKPLLVATKISEGRLELPDIGLPAGTYRIRLKTDDPIAYPFSLASVSQGPRSPGREEEPNDSVLTSRPLTIGQAMEGRISQPGDIDTYVLPAAAAGQLLSIQVAGASKAITRLCIGGADGVGLQCREGVQPSLTDVAMGDKSRFVTLSGGPSPGATYQVTARASGKVAPDAESEPNDTMDSANSLQPGMRGRFGGQDVDVYRFAVENGDLLTFTITGDAVQSVEVVDSQNQSSARDDRAMDAEAKPVPGPLALKDLALQPGTYFLMVSGKDAGDYTIASTAAPPAPVVAGAAKEREPNDAAERAQLLNEGERVSGVLDSSNDRDFYRLSVKAPGGVAIHLDADERCGAQFTISWESWTGALPRAQRAGKGFVYQGYFQPGDYLIDLIPADGCEATDLPYTFGYDLAPDIVPVGDVEPNDTFNIGKPMPPDLKVSGTVGQYRDNDWFTLPTVDADTEVTLNVTGDGVDVALTDGKATSSFQMAQPTELAAGFAGMSIVGVVPAGATAAIRVRGSGDYSMEVVMAGRTPPPAAATEPVAPATGTALTASLAFERKEIAAYWHRGQRLAGTLKLTNPGASPLDVNLSAATVPPGWKLDIPSTASVAAGEATDVPLSVEIEPDVFAARAIRVGVTAQNDAQPTLTANTDLTATIAAEPVGDHLAFNLPDTLRGGFNVAWNGLGGELLPSDKLDPSENPQLVNDGLGSNAGYIANASNLPVDFTIRFGGGRTWPIRGITINPQTPGLWPSEYIQDFELELSQDGTNFEPALKGKVTSDPREQPFLLPEVKQAQAARLRVLANHDGNLGRVGFSEWKVIADPQAGIGVGLDIADTLRGGHIVWSTPMISDQTTVIKGVLEAGGDGSIVNVERGVRPQFTVGFNENRAAQLTAIEWTDTALGLDARYMRDVLVEASTETPLGPWTSLGTLALKGEGSVDMAFQKPVWARFLRFTSSEEAPDNGTKVQFPASLHVMERATDADYRSVLGEWGQYSPDGFYETTLPPAPAARAETAGNETRETADPLGFEETVSGRVEIGKDEDWYKVVQPEGQDILAVTLSGEPTVGADVELKDEAGKPVALSDQGGTPRQALFEARVEPGKTYYLRVSQPPHSVVIAYDTSGSLLSFIPIIFNALEVFARGVTPGHESVNFLPFDGQPMLKDFSDQPAVLGQALAKDGRESTTSGLEGTAITAMRELATRRGTRAILVVTDAASSTITSQTDMWSMIEQVRPRIFAAHAGSFDDPMREKQLMEDMALASGGHYASSRSQAELDVAFDRVAAWLRRPAGYSLSVAARKGAPPEPGGLEVTGTGVVAANTEAYAEPASGAIEIVLDASGSMLKRMEGKRRIEIARGSLSKLVTEELKRDDPVALRVFGNDKPGSCETSLMMPLGPLDPDSMTSAVNGVEPQNLAKTPIAASLKLVGDDLAGVKGRKTVILLTDGEETCGGDPRAEIAGLAERDIEVRVNIVGFAVDDPALKGEFAEWARIGRGRYFDATKSEELDAAVKAATEVPFQVLDSTGATVGSGTVGGKAIELPAGSYKVEIATTPPRVFEGVAVKEKEVTKIDAGAV